MTLALTQSVYAVGANVPASFLATGGTGPYVYAVLPGGAGGTIDSGTGVYTAPAQASSSPATAYDTVQVTDGAAVTATASILVGTPLLLFCDVLQRELGLADGRVYLWDQKIMQPTDSGLYLAVSVPRCRPFGSANRFNGTTDKAEQYVAMQAVVDIDVISRGPEARDRKEEVILALNSDYAQVQQTTNSFFIGKLPPSSSFLNLSSVDGAAIPYRYRITVQLQYAASKAKAVPYYDDFSAAEVSTDP